jgi:hypothetical protein
MEEARKRILEHRERIAKKGNKSVADLEETRHMHLEQIATLEAQLAEAQKEVAFLLSDPDMIQLTEYFEKKAEAQKEKLDHVDEVLVNALTNRRDLTHSDMQELLGMIRWKK